MKKIIFISLLAIVLFGSSAIAKEPTAQEIQSWVVKYASQHIKKPSSKVDSQGLLLLPTVLKRGNTPCKIELLSAYKLKGKRSDLIMELDFKQVVTDITTDTTHGKFEVVFHGNIPGDFTTYIDKKRYESTMNRPSTGFNFSEQKYLDRHFKAYKKLLELCRDVKEDLF